MLHAADPFLLQLLVIFLWAKIFGEVFEQLTLPAVLGEILAGITLGPFAAGLVHPSHEIEAIGEIGAIFLLFSVGLATRPGELISVGRRSINVAIFGVVVPFSFGFIYLLLWHFPAHEATFVGAAMVATSVGISARVMGDMEVLHTRAARIILAAAVFDDVLGMVLLALVAGLATSAGIQWMQLSLLLVEAVAFTVFMIFYAPRVVDRMRGGLKRLHTHDAPLALSLAICLGLSVAAEKIGMAAIIGAFFAGLAFADYAPEWNLRARVTGITEFVSPFFFFVMGSKLNPEVFNWNVARVAIVISILAIVSKLLGCGIPVLHEGWRTALKVAVGMVPRGEVGLIVALVGLNMKVITEQSYAVVIFMTGITTVFAPLILRVLFRHYPEALPEVQAVAAHAEAMPQA